MPETPRTDETWRTLNDVSDNHEDAFPLMLIAEMLERIAIVLEAGSE